MYSFVHEIFKEHLFSTGLCYLFNGDTKDNSPHAEEANIGMQGRVQSVVPGNGCPARHSISQPPFKSKGGQVMLISAMRMPVICVTFRPVSPRSWYAFLPSPGTC